MMEIMGYCPACGRLVEKEQLVTGFESDLYDGDDDELSLTWAITGCVHCREVCDE
jgi:hypothetical protein